MALAFLRRLRDTTAPAHTAEAPDHDAVFRALARSPIVIEAIEEERSAELAARVALVGEIQAIEASTTKRVADLSSEAARARAEALALHRQWAAAERHHAGLAAELFSDMHRAEAAVRRLQHQLAESAPHDVVELRRELEDAIERLMAEKPTMSTGPLVIPHPVGAGETAGPRPGPARSGGADLPGPTPARGRPSRVPAPAPDDWYSRQQLRLEALRGLRQPARECAYAADPVGAVAAVRAEMVRLSKAES